MNLTTITSLLTNNHWHLRTDAGPALLPDGSIVRYTRGIDQHSIHSVVAFLRDYTDVKNITPTPTRKCYVTDPVIQGQTFAGNYRGGEVSWTSDPDNPKAVILEQVLLQGLITTADTLAAATARLTGHRISPADTGSNAVEEYIDLTWIGVDPDALYALASAKTSAAVVNSIAHRKFTDGNSTVTIGDGWYHHDTIAKLREDGSGEITYRLHKPRFTLNSYSDSATTRAAVTTYFFNVPKQLSQSVIDAWLAAHPIGATARPSYNTDGATADIICTYRKLDAPLHLTGILTDDECDSQTITDYHFAIVQADIATYTAGTSTPGNSVSHQLRDNGDGTFDVITTTKTRQLRDIPEYTAQEDAASQTDRKEWKGVTDLTPLATDLNTDISGKRVEVRIETLEDCSKLVTREIETPKDQTATSAEDRHDESSTRVLSTNDTSALSAPTASAGEIVEAVNRPTPFGTFQTELVTRTAKNQPATSAEVDRFSTRTISLNTQHTVISTPPSPGTGEIKSVTNEQTPFGKYRTVATTDVAVQNVREQVTYVDKDGDGTITICRNGTAAQLASDIAALSATKNNSVSIQHSRFKDLFDYIINEKISASRITVVAGDWDDFETDPISVKQRIYATGSDGTRYWADRTITFTVMQTRDAETAWEYLDGGTPGLDGSTVVNIGNTGYRATKVTSISEPSSGSDWHSMGGPA